MPILADFCDFFALFLHPPWLFMVVFAPRGILINENSENIFLCSGKSIFFNDILEKKPILSDFSPI